MKIFSSPAWFNSFIVFLPFSGPNDGNVNAADAFTLSHIADSDAVAASYLESKVKENSQGML